MTMSLVKYLVVVYLREQYTETHQDDTDRPLETISSFNMISKKFAVDRKGVRKIITEINKENTARARVRHNIAKDKRLSKAYKGKMYATNFGKLHYGVVRLADKEDITESFKTERTSRAIAQRTRRRLKSGYL